MTIQRVDMFQAACNVCRKTASDRGSDFYAWADPDQARDEWTDSQFGIATDDDQIFCSECVPADICRYGRYDEYKHTPDDSNRDVCAECERPIPALAGEELR